jgi:hypothetical protein
MNPASVGRLMTNREEIQLSLHRDGILQPSRVLQDPVNWSLCPKMIRFKLLVQRQAIHDPGNADNSTQGKDRFILFVGLQSPSKSDAALPPEDEVLWWEIWLESRAGDDAEGWFRRAAEHQEITSIRSASPKRSLRHPPRRGIPPS